ncbi:hypothetical protein AGMMS50268_01060 [Spirochaetia bacterium]|nr:hypothetical protein AGMMS50268_01060 [Spirochaetia bacterium]
MTVFNKDGASPEVTLHPARGDDAPRLIALMKKQHGGAGGMGSLFPGSLVLILLTIGLPLRGTVRGCAAWPDTLEVRS